MREVLKVALKVQSSNGGRSHIPNASYHQLWLFLGGCSCVISTAELQACSTRMTCRGGPGAHHLHHEVCSTWMMCWGCRRGYASAVDALC
jgi:hypothetical protein